MDLSAQKEKFSEAYVLAIAATAGYGTYKPSPDDDSVDLGIAARTSSQANGVVTMRSPRSILRTKLSRDRAVRAKFVEIRVRFNQGKV